MPTARQLDLAAIVAPYRRFLLRRRRLCIALLAAAAAFATLRVLAPEPPPSELVVVAAHDLEAGERLTSDDLRTVRVASELVPHSGGIAIAAAIGRVLAAPLRQGTTVTDRSVLGASLLAGYPAGTVAAPIRLPDADVAVLLHTGDRVDVYAAHGAAGQPAELVASDVAVIAVPEPTSDTAQGAILVLAATLDQAARLAGASATAALTVVLRG